VVVGGEITTKAYVEIPDIIRTTIRKIGYTHAEYRFDAESCGVLVTIHNQSPDIARGVNEGEGVDKEQGAGDQGMMFGYATNETEDYIPMPLFYAHRLVKELARIRKEQPGLMPYLRPDSKAQVTVEYDDNDKPVRVHTVVISTQHDDFIQPKDNSSIAQMKADEEMLAKIRKDVIENVIRKVIPSRWLVDSVFHVNPTGKFVIGGPHGDTGLTGRKIIVDTYGGRGAHGGGAFSGKDPSKVDRSAAYAARHIAKNMVAAGVADEMLVQVAYAIGIAHPVSLTVNTFGKSKVGMKDSGIADKILKLFDMRPKAIIERLGLKNPIFFETASYGHMGRPDFRKKVEVSYVAVEENENHKEEIRKKQLKEVGFFTWEKLDYLDKIKKEFGL
ncbi:MAG TPA: methionine adenosyltransferase, partial [Cyclobacteriaceae bacterium]|nr:methionine adenosyltransferase [Cyclobacteriaceae bacterium]